MVFDEKLNMHVAGDANIMGPFTLRKNTDKLVISGHWPADSASQVKISQGGTVCRPKTAF